MDINQLAKLRKNRKMVEWIALLLSIIALVIAMFTFIFQVKSYKRDKSKLSVDAEVWREETKPYNWYLIINLRNRGLRPCYVTKLDLKLPIVAMSIGDGPICDITEASLNIFKRESIKIEESKSVPVKMKLTKKLLHLLAEDKSEEGTIFVTDALENRIDCNFTYPGVKPNLLKGDLKEKENGKTDAGEQEREKADKAETA